MKRVLTSMILVQTLSGCSNAPVPQSDHPLSQNEYGLDSQRAHVRIELDLRLGDQAIVLQRLPAGRLFLSAERVGLDFQGQRRNEDLHLERHGSGLPLTRIAIGEEDLRKPINLSINWGGSFFERLLQQALGMTGTEELIVLRLWLETGKGPREILSALATVNPFSLSAEVTPLSLESRMALELMSRFRRPLIEAVDFGSYKLMRKELSAVVKSLAPKFRRQHQHRVENLLDVAETLSKAVILGDLRIQQKLANVAMSLPTPIREEMRFASRLDSLALEIGSLSRGREEEVLNTTDEEHDGVLMKLIAAGRQLPLIFTPSNLKFSDSDSLSGRYAGQLTIGRASDETDVKAYVVYLGEECSGRADLQKLGMIKANGRDLNFSVQTGSLPTEPLASPALWVFSHDGKEELSVPLKIPFADKGSNGWGPFSSGSTGSQPPQ